MQEWIMEEAFDDEGFCYSKQDKIRHTVLGALPKEKVLGTLVGRKRRTCLYVLDQVIEPNKDRVVPRCSEVPRCGGCVFQSLEYGKQLEHKLNKIRSLFSDSLDLIAEIIPSPEIYQYRAKMDFTFSQTRSGEKYLGLTQAQGNGRVMNTSTCHLAPSWMSETLAMARACFLNSSLNAFDRKGEGDLKRFIVREGRRTGDKMAILEIAAHPNSAFKQKDIAHFFDPLRARFGNDLSCYLQVVQSIKGQPTQHYEMHLSGKEAIQERLRVGGRELNFKISPSAFFQPNPLAAEVLFEAALSMIQPYKIQTALDLFCGTGSIGLSLASCFSSCIGVEINPYATFDAEWNAKQNQIEHISYVTQDAGAFIADYKSQKGSLDLVIVDPPRAGLGDKACKYLLDLEPKFILYISCNPKTQAIDAQKILEFGYKILAIQPVDQFPHTNHVENILFLQRLVE